MSSSKLILAFIAGAAAGAAAALLLSSDKGDGIKKGISDMARNLSDTILAKVEEVIDEAEKAAAQSESRSH